MFRVLFGLALSLCASLSVCVCAGDREEWEQQCIWHTELVSGLDKVDVCVEQLQQEQDIWIMKGGDCTTSIQAMVSTMGHVV